MYNKSPIYANVDKLLTHLSTLTIAKHEAELHTTFNYCDQVIYIVFIKLLTYLRRYHECNLHLKKFGDEAYGG